MSEKHTPTLNGCVIMGCNYWNGKICTEPSEICIYRDDYGYTELQDKYKLSLDKQAELKTDNEEWEKGYQRLQSNYFEVLTDSGLLKAENEKLENRKTIDTEAIFKLSDQIKSLTDDKAELVKGLEIASEWFSDFVEDKEPFNERPAADLYTILSELITKHK